MIAAGQLTGAVLAGGMSQRMGRDKATITHDGQPLWKRQRDILRSAGAEITAIVRRPGQSPLGLPEDCLLWHDQLAEVGPIAGLHAALSECRTSQLAVLAVDMPKIDAWWFQWLGSFCGSSIGAVACRPDGRFEPLAAIYPRIALEAANRHLQNKDYSLQVFAAALIAGNIMRSVPLPAGELWRVTNWNIPTDLAAGSRPPMSPD
jgi:molybdenum cofactor guanylyltransferase